MSKSYINGICVRNECVFATSQLTEFSREVKSGGYLRSRWQIKKVQCAVVAYTVLLVRFVVKWSKYFIFKNEIGHTVRKYIYIYIHIFTRVKTPGTLLKRDRYFTFLIYYIPLWFWVDFERLSRKCVQ